MHRTNNINAMKNLAIAYVTCDKYAHVWDEWYAGYMDHWDIELPVYWCGEETENPFGFYELLHKSVTVDHWTSKLREQIEQIPEEYIFVWLDDLIPQLNIYAEFWGLYDWMLSSGADSVRIMGRASKARYNLADFLFNDPIYKLAPDSRYRVSFSPNIYKKSFLLEVLQRDESPWASELNSRGMFTDRDIYAYHINGWYINKIVQ